uniref:biotin carboxylase n=1 Tax=candidate division WOR-3 bacterium TaxID=2052148 RepID=A0A7C4CE47_UNCW3
MFKKVLVADRGDAALRVIRSCRELGIPTVAAHSEPDRDSLPVLLADESVCIGPAPAEDSYLNVSRLLSAAEITRCDALHPGTSRLADDPEFADATTAVGLKFIGPPAETLRLSADRIALRRLMQQHGIPVIPASAAAVTSPAEATQACVALGLPVVFKPVSSAARALRIVRDEKDIEAGFRLCQAEARAAPGEGLVYVEKFVANARHIEVTVLCDQDGEHLALPERDCSVQYRTRKLFDESPSPGLSPARRRRVAEMALKAAAAVGVPGILNVEFLADERGDCRFLKLNSRLPTGHAVTELLVGMDICREQIRLAADEGLPDSLRSAKRLQPSASDSDTPFGHAVGCRIYAENPDADFEVSTGLVTDLHLPGGHDIRVDSVLVPGCRVLPLYDALVCRLTVRAADRSRALDRLDAALGEMVIAGVVTTVAFYRRLIQGSRLRAGRFYTGTLDEEE